MLPILLIDKCPKLNYVHLQWMEPITEGLPPLVIRTIDHFHISYSKQCIVDHQKKNRLDKDPTRKCFMRIYSVSNIFFFFFFFFLTSVFFFLCPNDHRFCEYERLEIKLPITVWYFHGSWVGKSGTIGLRESLFLNWSYAAFIDVFTRCTLVNGMTWLIT